MNFHPSYNLGLLDSKFCHIIKTRNDLQIERIEFFSDKRRNLLVLLLENNLSLEPGVKAFIQGKNLIIEAPRTLDYNKPFRTHLIERETLSDYEKGSLEIRFSEVQLNQNFSYSILSCMAVSSRLLKVILSFRPIKSNTNSTIN